MKKILILAIFVLTLTGCSATYEVEIYNDKVKEKLQYIETNSSLWGENVDGNTTYRETVINSSKHPYPAFYNSPTNEDDSVKAKGVQYYKNKLISDNYKLGQELSYNKFKLNNYPNSYIISKCYEFFNVIEENDQIIISTSNINVCFDKYKNLSNIILKLKTNHKVVSHNATTVNGYHYTWNISRNNKDNAAISIILKKDEYIFNYENEFIKNVLTIGGITAIIVIGMFSFVVRAKRKHDDLNKI